MLEFLLASACLGWIIYWIFFKPNLLGTMPGPKCVPILGNALQLNVEKPFLLAYEWAKQYGGMVKLSLLGTPVIVLNDPELVYTMFVTKGADFAGRPLTYRGNLTSENQSGIILTDAGPVLRARRKLLHGYIKQYGTGIKTIEDIVQYAVDDMIHAIDQEKDTAISMRDHLSRTVAEIMGILLTGESLTEAKYETVNEHLDAGQKSFDRGGDGELLDVFPFLRYFGNQTYKNLKTMARIRKEHFLKWMKNTSECGYFHFITSLTSEDQVRYHVETDMTKVNIGSEFLEAGILTTTATLTCLVNVLAHRQDVQRKLQAEVKAVVGDSRATSVNDKEHMPYHQATLFETGRFASIVPLAVPHKTVRDTTLGGYTIPAGTAIWPDLWTMHHDDKTWDEPFEFKPERFLDESGQVVLADHPNRKNLMPFGAGHRVCVGEVLAQTRMFLILSRLMQEFTILPETTTNEQPSMDPKDMVYGTVLFPPNYKVRCIPIVP